MQKHLNSKPKFKNSHTKSKRTPGKRSKVLTPDQGVTRQIQKKIEREMAARAVKFNETLEVVKSDPRHLKE
jgi:hypothetical protein